MMLSEYLYYILLYLEIVFGIYNVKIEKVFNKRRFCNIENGK